VDAYLTTMAAIPVDAIELGFRFLPDDNFYGPYAYTTDDFLRGLRLPSELTLAVMVNAKDLLAEGRPAETVDRLFDARKNSPVSLVRIAAHYREIAELGPAIERLSYQGYKVGLNVMQAGERTDDELARAAQWAAEHPVNILYFADS
jgi:4-hydroxy 2-oxovalerate aldolase